MWKLLRRLHYLMRQRRIDAELAEEIEAHRALRARDLQASGRTKDDAAFESRRAMGNATLAREDARAVWVPPSLESIWQDTRYAVRSLVRQPGFTAIATGTIAIAVGLNTSLFTVFSALAWRPWPVPEPERVVRGLSGQGAGNFSSGAIAHFAEHSRMFEGLFAARTAGSNVLGEDEARVAWVSGNYFRVLQVPLALGRPFTATDDAAGAPPVAVISHGYWQRRFGGDSSVVGQTIEIEAVPVLVMGVASRGFTGTTPDRTDLWMPLVCAATFRPTERWVRDEVARRRPVLNGTLMLAGRLRPGVTRQEAEAELTLLAAPLRSNGAPRVRLEDTTFLGGPKGAGNSEYPRIFGATLLVLLLACANVGNLLLARGAARRREVAVRLSLGASRRRVIRQLLTESLVLAIAAGFAGLVLAAFLPRPIVELIGERPTALQLGPDGTVLAFAFALSMCATILFGLAPALHATRASVSDALKDVLPFRSRWISLRTVLLTTQVALSVVLLVSAALLLRGVSHARAIDHGFDVGALTVVSFDVPRSSFDTARTTQFSRDLEESLAGAGGVERSAITQAPPLGSGMIKGSFRVAPSPDATEESNSVYDVSPGYFDVVGIPLVAGRLLNSGDSAGRVIVVNETLARLLGEPGAVIGRRLHVPADNGWNAPGDPEIVGVVRDTHTSDFLAPYPTLYQPYSGRAVPMVVLRDASAASVARVGALVQRIDPRVRLRSAPLSSMIDARLRGTRTFAILASGVGLVALVLATVGMFGVFAFWVQQRRHEIGIRMALGATRTRVMRAVLLSSAPAIGAGLTLGYAAAASASGVLRSALFGLNPLDPVAYASVMVLLATSALLATIVPARRAAAVDPVVALRVE